MPYRSHPTMSYHLDGLVGGVHCGGLGPLVATLTRAFTTVPDSTAVSTRVPVPAAAAAGTFTLTVAAPADTGTSPSATEAPLASIKTAFSKVFAGLPMEVRFSLETASVMDSPALTSAAVEFATATERRAKSGETGLCA